MQALLLSVGALITSLAILLAGNSLQFVILGLRAESEGFSLATIGAMTTAYYVGYALGSIRAPPLIDRIGHIRAFAALSSIISAIVLAHGLWPEPLFWIALRLVTGLCFAGLGTVVESWINAKATRDLRGRLLSIASIAAITGYAVGPLFAALGGIQSLVLFVIASMLMSFALVPVALTRFAAPAVSGQSGAVEFYGLVRLFRETPLGVIGCLATGLVQGAFLGLGAVLAGRLGLSEGEAPVFVTAALVGGALAAFPLGWLSDRMDRRSVIAFGSLIMAGACVAVAALLVSGAPPLPIVGLAALVAGVSAMPLYSIVIAFVNDRLPEPSIVPAAATLILTFSIGSAVAGPLASAALESMGPPGLFLLFGIALAVLGLFAIVRMFRTGSPKAAEHGVFAASSSLALMDTVVEERQLAFDFEARGERAG